MRLPPPPAAPSVADKPLVVLVSPDESERHACASYLREHGYSTYDDDDGRVALACAMSRSPVAVVTSANPHGLDGFQLCQLLRGDGSTRHLAIVFVASNALDHSRAVRSGADSTLKMPIDHHALEQEIERLRQGRDNGSRPKHSPRVADGQRRRALHTQITHEPPLSPPTLRCTECDQRLSYLDSRIGGVDHRQPEQWDLFECEDGCGIFQYRHRTRKLSRLD